MKTTFLLQTFLMVFALSVSAKTWVIMNEGFEFSPADITIASGDSVRFQLESIHNAVEVSEQTWASNQNTPLSGGFAVPLGGGLVLPSRLASGTHYYVCAPHADMGMKGVIIVQNSTGITENLLNGIISVYPNPSDGLVNIKTSENWTGSAFYIIDVNGRRSLTGNLTKETSCLNLNNLARGVYLLHLEGVKGKSVRLYKN